MSRCGAGHGFCHYHIPLSSLSVDACWLSGVWLDGHLLIVGWFPCRLHQPLLLRYQWQFEINWRVPISTVKSWHRSRALLSPWQPLLPPCAAACGGISKSKDVRKFVCLCHNRNGGEMLLGVCSSAPYRGGTLVD